jgi:hypothetical protein
MLTASEYPRQRAYQVLPITEARPTQEYGGFIPKNLKVTKPHKDSTCTSQKDPQKAKDPHAPRSRKWLQKANLGKAGARLEEWGKLGGYINN